MKPQGSQSKPVVLIATLFFAVICLTSIYFLFKGPDPQSVFFFNKHGIFFYPLFVLIVGVSGCMVYIGIKRVLTM